MKDTRDWRDDAVCKDVPLSTMNDPFYTDGAGNGATYATAAALCARCPVVAECLEDALKVDAAHGPHGFRAGMSGKTRYKLAHPDKPVDLGTPTVPKKKGGNPNPDPVGRKHSTRRKDAFIEEMEDAADLGRTAVEAAAATRIAPDSLYMRLHRAGRLDLWEALQNNDPYYLDTLEKGRNIA